MFLTDQEFAANTGASAGFSPTHARQWIAFWKTDICENDQFHIRFSSRGNLTYFGGPTCLFVYNALNYSTVLYHRSPEDEPVKCVRDWAAGRPQGIRRCEDIL